MVWLVSAAALILGGVLVALGRRGNRQRLSDLDDGGEVEVSLVDKWTVKGSDDAGVSWTFWWSVKRHGADKAEKVKVTEATYESFHPPAIVTLHVNPKTGRLVDEDLAPRVRLGYESVGWVVALLGVGLPLSAVTKRPEWTIFVPWVGLGVFAFMRTRSK